MLQVYEIFKSIQGESTYAGLPCIIIRLAGCPLRCAWCDTEYAFSGGKGMTIEDIVTQLKTMSADLVEITGGEPLAQRKCPQLAKVLLEAGYKVLVETSGALPIHTLHPQVTRIMDLKCPGSGEMARNDLSNLKYLQRHDEIKFVILDRRDYEWAREMVVKHELDRHFAAVHFSPVYDKMQPQELCEWLLADGLPVRMHLQMHKYIWSPDTRQV
jgi:7-carboxy-7-deazaguanine synthase